MAKLDLDHSNHWMRVTTPLGKDKVSLEQFSGHEAVSVPFNFSIAPGTDHPLLGGNLPAIENAS